MTRRLPLLLAFALAACGSSKTTDLSFEDFQARLDQLREPFQEPCTECQGTGSLLDAATGSETPCPECDGTGTRSGIRSPTEEEFHKAFGQPEKREKRPDDPI